VRNQLIVIKSVHEAIFMDHTSEFGSKVTAYKDLLLCLLFTFITWYLFTKKTFPHFLHIPLNKYKYLSLSLKSRLSCFLSPWTQVSNMLWSVGGQSRVHSTLYGDVLNVGVDSCKCKHPAIKSTIEE